MSFWTSSRGRTEPPNFVDIVEGGQQVDLLSTFWNVNCHKTCGFSHVLRAWRHFSDPNSYYKACHLEFADILLASELTFRKVITRSTCCPRATKSTKWGVPPTLPRRESDKGGRAKGDTYMWLCGVLVRGGLYV